MNWLPEILTYFNTLELVLLTISTFLLLASQWIYNHLFGRVPESGNRRLRITILRAINLAIILILLLKKTKLGEGVQSWPEKTLGLLLVLYCAFLIYQIIAWLIQRRFGKRRKIGQKILFSDTYNSRALSLLAAIFFSIAALISSIQILGFNSLLETGGIIGFFGVLLALTQASWAPDIISGLIMLNNSIVQEGDVIQIDTPAGLLLGEIYKTKMFHTEILSSKNNHRIMIKNSRLREYDIHNLSRFASARGLRECLSFKIDYNTEVDKVRTMFLDAYQQATDNSDIPIEDQYEVEICVIETGDHAVTWAIFYYLKQVEDLLKVRQLLTEIILDTSKKHGISLATPLLHQAQVGNTIQV